MKKPAKPGKRRLLGFTLIELMIVICILGILMAIMVPNLIRARFKAYHSGCLQDIRSIQIAMESYMVDNQGFPDQLDKLELGRYIAVLPTCPSLPSSNYNTGYEVSTDFKNYTISCPGVHYLQLQGYVRQNFPQVTAQGTITAE